MKERKCIFLFFISQLVFFFPTVSSSIHTLNATNFVDFNQRLVSTGDIFELRIFNPRNSSNWYLGICYKDIPETTCVWVANRDNPLSNSTGVVKIVDGNIVLLDQNQNPKWSTSSSISNGKGTVAELLGTGNLVLRDAGDPDQNNYLWQSFDFPTNTLLPGMKLGRDSKTGSERYLSWISQDPSTGNASLKLNNNGIPELFVLHDDQQKLYRSGPWNGQSFAGDLDYHITFQLTFNNQGDAFFSFPDNHTNPFSRLVLDPMALALIIGDTWNPDTGKWDSFFRKPKENCDNFGECGPYGICSWPGDTTCTCPTGFRPKNPPESNDYNQSDGCVRISELECIGKDFLNLTNVKLPEISSTTFVDRNMSLQECRDHCLNNCSCTAYASPDVNGAGCVNWVGELLDMREFQSSNEGQNLFVRVADSGNDAVKKSSGKFRKVMTIIGVVGIAIIFLLAFLSWKLIPKYRERKMKINQRQLFNATKSSSKFPSDNLGENMGQELQLFRFEELALATNNFSLESELGKGGFGPVYKGTLESGQEIAVKRLSRASGQGVEEFMNETSVISKIQHRNLVKLLGVCVEHEEKILVYEYMPNKSLDALLFDPMKKGRLDWRTRFNIIEGISRGLLYLHRDSRLRIIHRDLKAPNILLDEKLNPKISDFGMARIFQGDQDQTNTLRVVGTYGYMSPEYAMEERFSEKSDIFSFGVILLEIVSGRKNSSFYNDEHCLSLVGYAWKLWNEGNILDMVDKSVSVPDYSKEALRCIHVGLLCVQDFAEDRPTMSKVLSMINSEIMDLPSPKQPAFSQQQIAPNARSPSQDQNRSYSVNGVTITSLQGR